MDKLTPIKAKELSGLTFTVEELKNEKIEHLLDKIDFLSFLLDSNRQSIEAFKFLLGMDSENDSGPSNQTNKRSNPASSRAFLRVV